MNYCCNYTFLLGSKNWTRRIYKETVCRAEVFSTALFSSFSQGKCLIVDIKNLVGGEGGGSENVLIAFKLLFPPISWGNGA